MKFKKFIRTGTYAFFLGMVFTGCTKVVQIDLPPMTKKPVVYALVANHRPLQLYYGTSFDMLQYVDSSHLYSGEAKVNLFVNHHFLQTLEYDGKYFQSYGYLPKVSDTLSVQVIPKNRKDTVFAQTYIPQKIKIDSVWFVDSVYMDRDGAPYSRVFIRFKDLPHVKNYYEIYLRAKCSVNGKWADENIQAYYSDNPAIVNEGLIGTTEQIENEFLSDRQPATVVFSDTLFQNKEITIGITFLRPCDYITGQEQAHSFYLSVYLSNITKAYYEYRKGMFQHLNAQQNNLWDGYTEPIQMYSNVKGGYGVFAGYNSSCVTFYVR